MQQTRVSLTTHPEINNSKNVSQIWNEFNVDNADNRRESSSNRTHLEEIQNQSSKKKHLIPRDDNETKGTMKDQPANKKRNHHI